MTWEKEKIWAGGFVISTIILIFAMIMLFIEGSNGESIPRIIPGLMIGSIIIVRIITLFFNGYDYIGR